MADSFDHDHTGFSPSATTVTIAPSAPARAPLPASSDEVGFAGVHDMETIHVASGSQPCVILCRVSTKDQESGYSLPAQERLLSAYGARQGLHASRIFHIAESAAGRTQRRIFAEMLLYLRQESIHHLICEKVDRLTRNNKDAVIIDEWLEENAQRRVHFVKDTLVLHKNARSQEKLNWGIRVVMAKNYSDNLSEEVLKGHGEKFAQGIYPGSSPYGYRAEEQGRRKVHAIDPETASWVRRMFDLADKERYSVRRLEVLLRGLGVTSRTGRPISRSNIHRCLASPFYYGEIVWDGKRGMGNHEPLVTRAQWERVQSRMRKGDNFRYNSHAHLFKGLVRCIGCGGLISWEKHKGHTYGHCNGFRADCVERLRTRKWAKESSVDAQVGELLEQLVVSDVQAAAYIQAALRNDERDAQRRGETATAGVTTALERIQRRLTLLYDDRLDGRITVHEYDEKAAELVRERAQLKETLSAYRGDSGNPGASPSAIPKSGAAQVFSRGQRQAALYGVAGEEEKREVLMTVFSTIRMAGGGKLQAEFHPSFAELRHAVQQSKGSKVRLSQLPATATFEFVKICSGKQKNGPYTRSCLIWRDIWDEFRNFLA